jgi:hypothetical protein
MSGTFFQSGPCNSTHSFETKTRPQNIEVKNKVNENRKCNSCKKNQMRNNLESKDYWKNTLKLFDKLAIKEDNPDKLTVFLKNKVSDLCDVCGEKQILQTAYSFLVYQEVNNEKMHQKFFDIADLLMANSSELIWIKIKNLLINTIQEKKMHSIHTWKLFQTVVNMNGQSQHVLEHERKMIELFSKRMSIRELAYIFDRSTQTIHKIVSEIKPLSRRV